MLNFNDYLIIDYELKEVFVILADVFDSLYFNKDINELY